MSEKYTLKDVVERIEIEGLEYAIFDYITPEDIEDEKLKNLIIKAKKSLKNVEEYINSQLPEDFEYSYC